MSVSGMRNAPQPRESPVLQTVSKLRTSRLKPGTTSGAVQSSVIGMHVAIIAGGAAPRSELHRRLGEPKMSAPPSSLSIGL